MTGANKQPEEDSDDKKKRKPKYIFKQNAKMTDAEQRVAAKKFAEDWKDKGYEKGMSQPFWLSLLMVHY